jgi:molybdenum storage protein
MLPHVQVIKLGDARLRKWRGGGVSGDRTLTRAGAPQAGHQHWWRAAESSRSWIGIDLGLPTGVLAQFDGRRAGNAHIVGTLLAPSGVVAIPGHPRAPAAAVIESAPGVIFNGVPPYSLWEHPPAIGRIPPHRTDAGSFLLAECFGCKSLTLVKDVDGLYDRDPKRDSGAVFIPDIGVAALKKRHLDTLPFERVLLDLLEEARLMRSFQIVNGRRPDQIAAALEGEHVGTIVHADR